MAVKRSGNDIDGGDQFDAAGGLVASDECTPKHRNHVQRYSADRFQRKPLLPFAVELMPLGSQALTHGIWKDKPIEHARQTGGVFGDAASGRVVGNRGGTAGG